MANAWYRTGTCSVTNGSPTVTGSGTLWQTNVNIGDLFIGPDQRIYEVYEIDSNTSMLIKQPGGTAQYLGNSANTQAYAVVKTGPSNATLAAQLTALATNWQADRDGLAQWLGGTASGVVVSPAGQPSAGYYPLTDPLGVVTWVPCPELTATGKLGNGTVGAPAYSFSSDPDSGMYRIGANNIGLAVNGAKVLDIATTGLTVTGALGCGAITGSGAINISTNALTCGTVTATSLIHSAATEFNIYNSSSGKDLNLQTSGGKVYISKYADSSPILSVTDAGVVTAHTGLSVTGLLDLSAATSGQIKFPASQNASADANTLDDYEEGTWTPAYSTTGGSFTYDAARYGRYTKVGNLVTCAFHIYTKTATTVGSSYVKLTGLPFTAAASNTVAVGACVVGGAFASNNPMSEVLYDNTNEMYLYYKASVTGVDSILQASDLSTVDYANELFGTISYFV